MDKYVSWFSCGAASAVATKLAIKQGLNVRVVNQEIKEEHPDNKRFLKDCEKWFGQEIEITGNDKYNRSIYAVFKKRRYLSGVAGAPCTQLLKKEVNTNWCEDNTGYKQIFGFTVEEQHRLDRLIDANNEIDYIAPLIDQGLTKQDCLAIIQDAGIEIPTMYKLGFKNNNCIGCVKAGGTGGYWLLIKKHFPEVFQKMNQMEKMIGARLLKRTEKGETVRYRLDQIPTTVKPLDDTVDIQCGIFCELTKGEING
jgi:3'-phosphoadenosine 5'-phosphosulfate sulfotransferase (PAPS reductase)/FAD synthetase